MTDYNAYENVVPGRRDPTPEDWRLLQQLTQAMIQVLGVEHTIRMQGSLARMLIESGNSGCDMHLDCFDRADESGKMVAFVYIGSEFLDTMAQRADTQAHFAELHANHAEATRAMDAKEPKAN